jgi:putative methionine-R-sulfoxide reductase with GAF domain
MATRRRWVGIYRVIEGQVENLAWSGVGPPAYPSFSVESGVTAAAIREARTVVSNDVAADARYLTNQETTGDVDLTRFGGHVGAGLRSLLLDHL